MQEILNLRNNVSRLPAASMNPYKMIVSTAQLEHISDHLNKAMDGGKSWLKQAMRHRTTEIAKDEAITWASFHAKTSELPFHCCRSSLRGLTP